MSAYTPAIRTVDISEWTAAERADIRAPFAVDGAPYGESIPTQWHGTEAEAVKDARWLYGQVTGDTYTTSWGTVPADAASIRITHYADYTPAPEHEHMSPELCPVCGLPPLPSRAAAAAAPEPATPVTEAFTDEHGRSAIRYLADDVEAGIAAGSEVLAPPAPEPYTPGPVHVVPGGMYSPEGEPVGPHYGTPFGRPTSHPSRALTASMLPLLPASAREASRGPRWEDALAGAPFPSATAARRRECHLHPHRLGSGHLMRRSTFRPGRNRSPRLTAHGQRTRLIYRWDEIFYTVSVSAFMVAFILATV